jgi:hypothetical protein
MTTATVHSQLHKPGDQIAETGTYLAHHVGIHCSWPKATLEAHRLFPACPTCGQSVRYVLGRTSTPAGDELPIPQNGSKPRRA